MLNGDVPSFLLHDENGRPTAEPLQEPMLPTELAARLAALERIGASWQLPGGGFYVLVARKLVVGLRPLRQPSRQPVGKLLPMPVAKVSRRDAEP